MSDSFYAKLRVLVVDDNRHARKLATTILKSLGCPSVFEAAGAEDGWTLLVEHDPHVLLVDLKMKPVDGLELTRRVRNDPACPNNRIPIILITAEPSLPAIQAAREAGVDEVLPKPFSPQGLRERIDSIVNRAGEGGGDSAPARFGI